MTDTQKIADRIAKLLAKAEGTDSTHEAAALLDKAEALMVQHAIDRSMVAADDTRDEQIITRQFRVGRKSGDGNQSKHYLVQMIARANGGFTYYMSGRGSDTGVAHIVAHESDADLIADIAASMLTEAASGAVRYADEHRGDTEPADPHRAAIDHALGIETARRKISARKLKRSYLTGFCHGAGTKLDGMRDKIVDAAGESGALVLARDNAVAAAEAAMDAREQSSTARNINGDAYESGKAAGASSDVGSTRIGGVRGALTG